MEGVIFDWRGTLVTTLDGVAWVREALCLIGRDASAEEIWQRVSVFEDLLDAPGVDTSRAIHHAAYYRVFSQAGLDKELADALYAVESDPAHNPFAVDAADTLRAVSAAGCRVAVLSDIHFDLRPVFAKAGLADVVDVYALSYELGVQKPSPEIFRHALAALGTSPSSTLMVGDRARPDGGAVELGLPVLLVPPLRSVAERRLHLVTALVGAA
ncbi:MULTISPECIES: HAD family hydrolase [Actinokineospora]|uniref:Hydrolase n=1 Tax=Actinokineospora fastidiosa TaxID=1816 RepID=A0A918G8Q0_9PSEU|nr:MULTISPECIES: HAD family hydrolase [Actinokineospora]UVS82050.1 (S)-2-haloacid dehalogenase 4A [Actinokineospora sp. UTMC 2448]GGS23881.1 hydrolase [Actinokineospora fastidiosa]